MKTDWDYTDLAEAYLKRPDYSEEAIDKMLALSGNTGGEKKSCLRHRSRRGTPDNSAPETRFDGLRDRTERRHARQRHQAHRTIQKRDMVRGRRRTYRSTFEYIRSGHVRLVVRRHQPSGSTGRNSTHLESGRAFRVSLESSRSVRQHSEINRRYHQNLRTGLRLRSPSRRSDTDHRGERTFRSYSTVRRQSYSLGSDRRCGRGVAFAWYAFPAGGRQVQDDHFRNREFVEIAEFRAH